MQDQRSIHEFLWLQEVTEVDPSTLGAVMLPVEFTPGFLERGYELGATSPDDLYTSTDERRFWIAGDVTAKAHVTLKYGLLTPAYEQPNNIRRLLADWECPAWLPVTGYELFASPYPDEEYGCIVARIGPVPELTEASGLLSFLPHVDTFTEPKMHATIAYVKQGQADAWLEYLDTRKIGRDVAVKLNENGRPKLSLGKNK